MLGPQCGTLATASTSPSEHLALFAGWGADPGDLNGGNHDLGDPDAAAPGCRASSIRSSRSPIPGSRSSRRDTCPWASASWSRSPAGSARRWRSRSLVPSWFRFARVRDPRHRAAVRALRVRGDRPRTRSRVALLLLRAGEGCHGVGRPHQPPGVVAIDAFRSNRSPGLTLVRVVLPAATAVAGVVLVIVGGDAARGAGVMLIGVAALVVVANLMIRLAIQSQDDREREEERRRYFSEHGRWPDRSERR